ncbi:MAG: RnfABCDGE type electron transport complex subunit G [Alphaproteobacteria bacterium]
MKQKISSSFINMVGVLFFVTLISASSLAGVYKVTKNIINEIAIKKQQEALKAVIATDYDNNPFEEKTVAGNIEVYPAKKNGDVTSYAIKSVSSKGYNGNIEIMLGLLPDGVVSNLVIVSQSETPGLGTRVTEPPFVNQFNGKNLAKGILKVKKDGGDVDAITGATISSRAVTDAIARAYYYFVNGKEMSNVENDAKTSSDSKTGASKLY